MPNANVELNPGYIPKSIELRPHPKDRNSIIVDMKGKDGSNVQFVTRSKKEALRQIRIMTEDY